MKISFKGKGIIKKLALVLAGVAALTGIGFGVKAIVDYTKEDLETISPKFEVGNLGADGKWIDDESTLYTKEAFQCDGLEIKLDFDNEINYQIFFYDDLDNFIESTQILSESYSGGVHDSYARLVIIPTADEDDKISWTEKISYPKQMDIKVSKIQFKDYANVFNKRLRVVDNVSAMRFVYGDVSSKDGVYSFVDSTSVSVTSKDVLTVKYGEKLTFDPSRVSTPEGSSLSLDMYQLRYIDGHFEVVEYNRGVQSCVFNKNTTHVILRCALWDSVNSTSVKVPESDLAKINHCLAVAKNR